MADRLAHPLDLVLAALVQHEHDARGRAGGPGRGGRPVVELDAASELPQRLRVRLPSTSAT